MPFTIYITQCRGQKTQGDAQQAQRAAEECALAYRQVNDLRNVNGIGWGSFNLGDCTEAASTSWGW